MRREAQNWLYEANYDLRRAESAFNDSDYALSVFMAQQAIEKAFNALIIALKHESPPKTHDLIRLYNELKDYFQLPNNIVDELPEVSQYYVTARYPNAGLEIPSESITRAQAERALAVAREVVRRAGEAIAQGN